MDLHLKSHKALLGLFLCFKLGLSAAACSIYNSDDTPAAPKNDALYLVLSQSANCPNDLKEFKDSLKSNGLKSEPSMVANRGFHNPEQGSFSYFEVVKDKDLFFGHFTGLSDNKLVLDQEPTADRLMIQSIVWDPKKGLYNFYELRGKGGSSRWYYRGDSVDALLDNQYLFRTPPEGVEKFGHRMRCSACHNAGTPIMKELSPPFNDWWVKSSHLPLGSHHKTPEIIEINRQIVDASVLSQAVKQGMKKLYQSDAYLRQLRSLSLQEQLRPLFCTTEINLASDPGLVTMNIEIPSGFWLDSRLGEVKSKISVVTYEMLLRKFKVKYPESTRKDAEYAWLTPVRSFVDQLSVDRLIDDKVVSHEFVKAVLGVDFTHPIFSNQRCELLKLIPDEHSVNWRQDFENNLRESELPAAHQLLSNMHDGENGFPVLDAAIQNYQSMNKSPEQAFKRLLDVRRKIVESEISQNPEGQILEPGFRIVFPEASK